mmetsp:Transcript_37979/g.91321  ORF Transcript_37979/g.91321 Transcript_37979/m.91321 type:complete len:251 (+) Transcript_37979:319-1071(+)
MLQMGGRRARSRSGGRGRSVGCRLQAPLPGTRRVCLLDLPRRRAQFGPVPRPVLSEGRPHLARPPAGTALLRQRGPPLRRLRRRPASASRAGARGLRALPVADRCWTSSCWHGPGHAFAALRGVPSLGAGSSSGFCHAGLRGSAGGTERGCRPLPPSGCAAAGGEHAGERSEARGEPRAEEVQLRRSLAPHARDARQAMASAPRQPHRGRPAPGHLPLRLRGGRRRRRLRARRDRHVPVSARRPRKRPVS